MARRLTPLMLMLALLGAPVVGRASAVSCAGTLASIQVDTVVQTQCNSAALGGVTNLSYFVPTACTASSRCPVLYLLHGFGGNDTDMIGAGSVKSAYVRALTEDPVTGSDLPDLNVILVAPEGRTVAGGQPPAGQESYWVDWNPKLWSDPPRFEQHVTSELVGLIDRSLPTISGRSGRAIAGVSLGGFGAFKLGFQHPDLYASAGSISGALNILVAPDVQPAGPGPAGAGGVPARPPVEVYAAGPRVAKTPPGFPFGDPFGAFGDPGADETYFRGNNPLDLAVNARGLPLRFFNNDAVPRNASDFTNFASYVGAQALEAIVVPMNAEMVEALTQHGMSFAYSLHPGLHSATYWNPYIREQLEWHAQQFAQPTGAPASFDYRSIRRAFSVWGWSVNVGGRAQDLDEFTTLWDASADGVTVTGSGRVTITTPPLGITGVSVSGAFDEPVVATAFPDGHAEVTFTLAPAGPTDEHAGASGIPGWDRTARITFDHA